MVRLLLETFARSLSACVGRVDESDTSPAESTERQADALTIMLCFMVLSFWIAIFFGVVVAMMYGGPRLWKLVGLMVTRSLGP